MAVDKELLARYKELKAQGINISLAELKAQGVNAGAGVNVNTNTDTGINTSIGMNISATNTGAEVNVNTCNMKAPHPNLPHPGKEQVFSGNESSAINYPSATSSTWQTVNTTPEPSPIVQPYAASYNTAATSPYTGNLENHPRLQEQTAVYKGNISQTPQQNAEDNKTKKFALIGYPLGHSLSTFIHNAGFKSLDINASYEILETPPESLVDRIKYLKTNNYSGFNVTIPLKLPVTMFLNEVDVSADIVNAVNTVVIDPVTKELKGYNTDVIGFKNAIPDDVTLCGRIAGILGTGGAARAAIMALAQSQMKEIKLFTRNVPNSIELLNFLREKFPNVEFNAYQIERIRDLSDIDILVNTTPIGMQGRAADMTPVEERELTTLPAHALVYDVIYNPKKTVLLKLAQKHGYRTLNGVDMFIGQALAAEQIWTGKTPDFKDMKIAALENL